MEATDRGLIGRAQAGDESAFAAIASKLHPRFLQVSYRIVRDRHVAEDVSQAALLRIWQKLPTIRDADRFDAWAYRVLVNACYNEVRDQKRRRVEPLGRVDPIGPDELGIIDERDRLERAFAELSIDQRAVIVLHFYGDMTLPEISRTLEVPLGTVNSRLGRGMSRLRAALASERPITYAADGGTLA